ncbi:MULTISPECIES: STAS domain-containing protein [Streptomyces]|uniref:Sulfate transporter n=1 Tax=Streptomyces virginiae TaxID=1961 RepID=A0ABQ3NQ37_STRVG|nr:MULTISPECIES: STAS domain-containing protein [Streptomyces]MBP2341290.1 anti-anti-sigma factor [Streptomyces virginiae]MCI4079021.1 STAS domain-containing protein [Streptomyces sp. MMS21 TC-5]GGQ19510.1 sulfate transporter [Streptomyces virginiae]GHI14852.1 sulfate transporter [Streptomyces virginiae]GLV95358.1 sulfate transporter [Streptomyces lavendulae subsp. lavendulae]
MTSLPSAPLGLTFTSSHEAVRVELSGDLDHRHADLLVEAVDRLLAAHPGLRDLRLDCTGLSAVDSSGLSALLMVRRRTDRAGAGLHLDGRTVQLNRLLEITCTLDHLTAPSAGAQGLRRTGGSACGGQTEENLPAAPSAGPEPRARHDRRDTP